MDAQRIAQDGGARGTKRTVLLAEDNSALADVISLAIGGLAEELVVVSDGVRRSTTCSARGLTRTRSRRCPGWS